MKQHLQDIQSSLTCLLKAAHDMNACLLEEQAALSNVDSELILQLTEQKKTIVRALEQQAVQFHKQLIAIGISTGLSGFNHWLDCQAEQDVADMKQQWTKTQELTQANKTLNEGNGACIALSQRQAQRSIEILRGQQGTTSQTYGRDGTPQSSNLGIRHTVV